MKTTDKQKSQIIAYLFLLGVTCLEIVLFCTIFNAVLLGGKMIGVTVTSIIFNFTIWHLAIRYHRTKRRCENE